MITFVRLFCLAAVGCTLLSGCFRQPGEDDYCVIPATNNPSITRCGTDWTPGVGY